MAERIYARYEVQFNFKGTLQSSIVALTWGYTEYEDIRKILAMRLTGNAESIVDIEILTTTKMEGS